MPLLEKLEFLKTPTPPEPTAEATQKIASLREGYAEKELSEAAKWDPSYAEMSPADWWTLQEELTLENGPYDTSPPPHHRPGTKRPVPKDPLWEGFIAYAAVEIIHAELPTRKKLREAYATKTLDLLLSDLKPVRDVVNLGEAFEVWQQSSKSEHDDLDYHVAGPGYTHTVAETACDIVKAIRPRVSADAYQLFVNELRIGTPEYIKPAAQESPSLLKIISDRIQDRLLDAKPPYKAGSSELWSDIRIIIATGFCIRVAIDATIDTYRERHADQNLPDDVLSSQASPDELSSPSDGRSQQSES